VQARRADVVAVIGTAFGLAALGWGYRQVADRVGRAPGTVRGWLRRLRVRAEGLRAGLTTLLAALDPLAAMPEPAVTAVGDAVAAVMAAAVAVTRRWGAAVDGLSPWELAGALTSGGLLAPPGTTYSINTSRPW
jgi:transposase-like protein